MSNSPANATRQPLSEGLAALKARKMEKQAQEKALREARAQRSAFEWAQAAGAAARRGGADAALAELRDPCEEAQRDRGNRWLGRAWWSAMAGCADKNDTSGIGALEKFAREEAGSKGIPTHGHEATGGSEGVVFGAFLARGWWEPVDASPFLQKAVWDNREIFAGMASPLLAEQPRAAAEQNFWLWAQRLRQACPPGEEAQAANAIFQTGAPIAWRAERGDAQASRAMPKKLLAGLPADDSARVEILGFALRVAARQGDPRRVAWLMNNGAEKASAAIAGALEECATLSTRLGESIAATLLAGEVEWARCWALGNALSRGETGLAEILLKAGAPATGPATELPKPSGSVVNKDKVRWEPLAGALLLAANDLRAGQAWIERLLDKGANPHGAQPERDLAIRLAVMAGERPEPALRALDGAKGGGLRPGSWGALKTAIAMRANTGKGGVAELETLVGELRARKDGAALQRVLDQAAAKASANEATAGSSPSAQAAAPRRARRV